MVGGHAQNLVCEYRMLVQNAGFFFKMLDLCKECLYSVHYIMLVLRTPVGTGALQCWTWYSYLGVYCSGFEDGSGLDTRLSTLYTLLCTPKRPPPSRRSTQNGRNVQNINKNNINE